MKKILAKHKWLLGCVIYEMIDTETEGRYFVATVYGFGGFYLPYLSTEEIIREVSKIRGLVGVGDQGVFTDKKYFKETVFSAIK